MFEYLNEEQIKALSPEDLKKYEAAKKAHEKKKADGQKNSATKAETGAGATKDYFDEQGAKSRENRAIGGDDVKVSLTNKTTVTFIKNYGFFKKGHTQEVSDVALAIYEKAKVIEKH